MALTTLEVRWSPLTFWTLSSNLDPVRTLEARWSPLTFWRSPLAADVTAPSVTADIAAGDIAHDQMIRISCADLGGTFSNPSGVAHLVVWVIDPDGNAELVADVRSVGSLDIGQQYDGAATVGASGNGFFVDVLRADPVRSGWPWASFTLKAVAVDGSGNETTFTRAYTVSPDYETAPVRTFTPASLSTIDYTDALQLDVTETAPDEIANVLIVAGFTDRSEVVFDGEPGSGNSFDGYSVVESSPGGAKRWVIERDGGWPTNVSLFVVTTTLNPRTPTTSSVASYTVTPPEDPTIVFDPATGASFDYDTATPIEVEVTDPAGVTNVRIYVVGATRAELVYDDAPGGTEQPGYTVVQTVITDGRRYAIERVDGWLEDFSLFVIADNAAGESDTEVASYTLDTLPSPGDSVPPVTTNVTPTPGTPIDVDQAVSVDVTDDTGLFRRVLIAVELEGQTELAWDGDTWLGHYADGGSVRDPIASGFRFTVLRDGGWPSSPTLRVFAFDQGGNEV
jgi:hypothetical protein